MQLFVGTPSYSKKPHPAHRAAVRASGRRLGDAMVYQTMPGDSCLSRARAALLGVALQRERPWTHFLQVDDDQSWDPDTLEAMLRLDHPIVGLPCAFKSDEEPLVGRSTVRFFPGPDHRRLDPDGTVPVQYLGGGFILWRFDVLEALCAAHPELRFTTNDAANAGIASWWLWGTGVADGEGLTEDYWICHLAEQLGYERRAYLLSCSPHWAADRCYVPRGYVPRKAA